MSQTVISMQKVRLDFPRRRSLKSHVLNLFQRQDNQFTALKGINLEIEKGEIIGVIGTNGCGKSTLLRVITGIYPPNEGVCRVNGNISLLAGLGTGFSGHQTGRENAILYGSILGYTEEKIIEKLPEIISFSELGEFIDEPIRTYSAGMKARLGLAVASAIQPEILLIDEVLGVGDPTFKEKSTNRIMEMVQEAGTVVIVSHSFGMLSKICDRIVLMEKGKIIQQGDPNEVIQTYYNRAKGINKEGVE
jgi:ABC-type polysaccharide/polyol phosphate transport system ATPase subunit